MEIHGRMLLARGRPQIACFGLLAAVTLSAFNCARSPDPDRVLKGTPDFKVTAVDLQREYAADNARANSRYQGRIIEVSGVVKSVTDGVRIEPLVVFEPGGQDLVQATFHANVATSIPTTIQPGQSLLLWCESGGSFGNVLLKHCVVK